MTTSRKVKTERAPERAKRIPMSGGARSILVVENQDPNYKYRWVNDKEGRIERFKAAYYEMAPNNVIVGERTTESDSGVDSVVTKKVGGNITAYLMRIKKEYFLEDRKAKAAEVDQREESLFRELNKQEAGLTGDVKFSRE